MTRRLLLGAVFLGALTLAVAAWIVEGARWLLAAPARAVRAARGYRARTADAPEAPPVPPAARRA